jgi:membrane protein DedA with SNARE-associated domain
MRQRLRERFFSGLLVMIESAGIPIPRETGLVSAAVYAGTRDALDIRFVIAAAAAGAIVGDKIGLWAGREFGEPSLALAVVIGFVLWRYCKKHEEILLAKAEREMARQA